MKKNIVILVLGVLLVICAVGLSTSSSDLVDSQTNEAHAKDCWNQAASLSDQGLALYDALLDWQNAGYQADDYAVGVNNTKVAKYNADIETYNSQCAGTATQIN